MINETIFNNFTDFIKFYQHLLFFFKYFINNCNNNNQIFTKHFIINEKNQKLRFQKIYQKFTSLLINFVSDQNNNLCNYKKKFFKIIFWTILQLFFSENKFFVNLNTGFLMEHNLFHKNPKFRNDYVNVIPKKLFVKWCT